MNINKEGCKIITITLLFAAAIAAASFVWAPVWAAWIIAAILAGHTLLTVYFFRDPKRQQLCDPDVVYSPADGKIVAIEPVKVGEYLGDERIQVSVFMSITNVHVNWYPVAGKVVYFRHHHGKFLVAWHPKSSEENERTTTVVDTGRHKILFRQIAGLVARRIVSYAKEDEEVTQNSKCGFIKFGSRVDVMLPTDSEILVKVGECVTGSQTPLARLK